MMEKLQSKMSQPGGEIVTGGCRFLSPNQAVSVMIETLDWVEGVLVIEAVPGAGAPTWLR
jgi:hypothetical protein